MPNIASSIQDYCRKINSRLTFVDIVSLALVLVFLVAVSFVISYKKDLHKEEVIYKEGEVSTLAEATHVEDASKPFGSRSGKTYTFSWCRGSSAIHANNKIYFASALEAKNSGRTLSKLCNK